MRQRRAILFDDDPAVLGVLALFFEGLGYEVIASREPVTCPVTENSPRCDGKLPCSDIVITDLAMPGMDGIELLLSQGRMGCPVPVMNKAVLSGSLDTAALEAIRRLGCGWFRKPVFFAQLREWVRECEFRMDLSRPLRAPRRERREACLRDCLVIVGLDGEESVAEVINRSPSGICLRVERPAAVGQEFDLKVRPPGHPGRLKVRWTKPDAAGAFLVGAACR